MIRRTKEGREVIENSLKAMTVNEVATWKKRTSKMEMCREV